MPPGATTVCPGSTMGKQGEEGRVPGLPERLDVLVVDDDRVVLDELFACLE